ncbi:MAG: MATE family efflux transporter, partial [Ramlibacter sp.]
MADSSTAAAASPEVPRLPPARPLWRVFLAFLGPMILANILQSLSGTLNNVF